MADLDSTLATEATRIVGSNSAGLEQTPVQSTSSGGLHVNLRDASGNEEGTRTNNFSVADILDNGGVNGTLSVGTAAIAARVGASNLTNRKSLSITALGNSTIYWGYSTAVTVANGTPIVKNQQAFFAMGPNTTIYLISSTNGNDTRITEGA